MRAFFKNIDEAMISYINKTQLKPTHILISHKKLEELFYFSRVTNCPFFHNLVTDEIKIFNLIVVVVDINVLGGDVEKFLLLADETSEKVQMGRLSFIGGRYSV